jgi:hypothetical protein
MKLESDQSGAVAGASGDVRTAAPGVDVAAGAAAGAAGAFEMLPPLIPLLKGAYGTHAVPY